VDGLPLSATLVLFAAPRLDGAALEALRVAAALAATGRDVMLAEVGPARGLLLARDAPDEVQRHLDALEPFDVRPRTLDGDALRDALRDAASVVAVRDPARTGLPVTLDVGGLLAEEDDAALLARLLDAGQVVPASRGPERRDPETKMAPAG
jgi:hypothetical protein